MKTISIFLLNFCSIAAFSLFLCQSILLFLRGRNNKARRVLSYVYLLFSLFILVRVVVFHFGLYPSVFPFLNINTIIIGSFILILNFLYPVEVITPGWLNKKRTLLFFLPIAIITAFYLLYLHFTDEEMELIYNYGELFGVMSHFNVWFRFVFILVSTVYIFVLVRMIIRNEKRYDAWKNNMFADREAMEVSWMKGYALFLLLIYMAWLCNILLGGIWSMILYTVFMMVCTSFVFYNAIFHENPYPENYFLDTLNEEQALQYNENKILLPADAVLDLSDSSFRTKIPEYMDLLTKWMEHEKPYLYKDFKLTDISRVLPLNRTYLSRIFNEGFHQSFYEVVRSYRVTYSKTVLESHTDLSLNEVARQCGFSSDTTFIRAFNQVEGMTPIAYKEAIKKKG